MLWTVRVVEHETEGMERLPEFSIEFCPLHGEPLPGRGDGVRKVILKELDQSRPGDGRSVLRTASVRTMCRSLTCSGSDSGIMKAVMESVLIRLSLFP